MGKLVLGKCQTMKVKHSKSENIRYWNKGRNKDKLAKQCIGCESNKDGFCNKSNEWCCAARVSCKKCIDKPKEYNYQKKYAKRNKKRNKDLSNHKKMRCNE